MARPRKPTGLTKRVDTTDEVVSTQELFVDNVPTENKEPKDSEEHLFESMRIIDENEVKRDHIETIESVPPMLKSEPINTNIPSLEDEMINKIKTLTDENDRLVMEISELTVQNASLKNHVAHLEEQINNLRMQSNRPRYSCPVPFEGDGTGSWN